MSQGVNRADQGRGGVFARSLDRMLWSPALEALAAPHGVERYLEQLNPMWSRSAVRARVVHVRHETADCATLTLRPNRHWAGAFQAGQYLRVELEVDGIRRRRCYSISSSPHRADGLIQMTVKRQPGGRVSGAVHEKLGAGRIVTLSQAEGDFVLPAQRPEHLLLIAGGSGITPMMSMLRALDDEGHAGRVTLIHYARRPADRIFGAELTVLAARRPLWRILPVFTAQGGAHLGAATLAAQVPDHAQALTYVCGPTALIAAAEQHWGVLGLQDRLRIERFSATPAAAAAGDACGDLHFARSERHAANNGRSLLDQAEAAGLRPESGCRMGICHSCSCRKTRGAVRNLRTGQLSTEPGETIQLCVSVAVGDVTLDL